MKYENMYPTITLRGVTVLPAMIVHLDISRDRSMAAVERAMEGSDLVFLVTQKDSSMEEPGQQDVYENGTIARIKNVARMPHGLMRVMVEGIRRARLLWLVEQDRCLLASVDSAENQVEISAHEQIAMVRALKDLFTLYAQGNKRISQELSRQILEIQSLPRALEQIAINLPVDHVRRQEILDGEDIIERYNIITTMLAQEVEIARIKNHIQQEVKKRIDKSQKEYYLREQLKVIQTELGEDIPLNEAEQYKERLSQLACPDQIREKISREIIRFKSLSGNSAEASVSRTYIETLLDMPWEVRTTDSTDLKKARKILDEDHYGLEKVKERILEYLAVRQLTNRAESPILCLAGPPGTGKTSIARSLARALGRKYIRISLGGIRDEAEVRGHRRTYIGAMPGRIANGIRSAGVINPLMLLDEVDKLSMSYNGDPSSALLEVLDSEQNCHFSDHYLDVPLDLSQVLFIATANDLHTIPVPLLDRMEVIEVSSYTENEKLHIAKEHLLPKQRERHGLKPGQLSVSGRAMHDIITCYTREAGVRKLERKLGEICRKAARQILEDGQTNVRVKAGNLEEYLGRKLYREQKKNDTDEIGIVRGLAWTSVGGVTLQVEVNTMPGKGDFVLTGQLGDVMKESARTAITYVRSIAGRYDVPEEFFAKNDIHIHIPEGAVPKDGPSAGITMATAILSAAAGLPVRSDVAMTGEITLRGRVLPIGGLKEKLLAAKNARMHTVIVPEENKGEVGELSEEITGGLTIIYAQNMETVLKTALP